LAVSAIPPTKGALSNTFTGVTIEPETKNWTWVLERGCEECGFDARAFQLDDLGALLREAAEPWPEFLNDPLVRTRPRDDCWSALEYACHVRDVFRIGTYRLQRMLDEDDPRFDNWDQDESAITERYDQQDPREVAADIATAAAIFADLYETVKPDQWQRPGMRSDGSPFTVESFGRYFVHDPMHHIVDVRSGLDALHNTA
jgi:hypothetical protein